MNFKRDAQMKLIIIHRELQPKMNMYADKISIITHRIC